MHKVWLRARGVTAENERRSPECENLESSRGGSGEETQEHTATSKRRSLKHCQRGFETSMSASSIGPPSSLARHWQSKWTLLAALHDARVPKESGSSFSGWFDGWLQRENARINTRCDPLPQWSGSDRPVHGICAICRESEVDGSRDEVIEGKEAEES